MQTPIRISIVSPVYRSESLVATLVERISASVEQLTQDYEIVLVEDCGPDASWEKIVEQCKKNPKVVGIKLSRNFGQQYAIQAGLDAARGEWVVVMDCDLQDRPEEIPKLYQKGLEGFDIVLASRKNRKDNFFKKFTSQAFYAVLSYLTDVKQDPTVAHFMLLHRKVVDALKQIADYHRSYPMLVKWVGFRVTKVEIQHAEREDGKSSSYSFKKRLNLAVNTILSFSDKPLRLIVNLGLFISLIAVLIAVSQIYLYLKGGITVQGWTSLFIALSFFSGLIITTLGVIGLYLGKVFESMKGRPTYIISQSINSKDA
ncbi:MAG: glycosyltransferase family 2 protein [Chloroherpetonaceae bacterium]